MKQQSERPGYGDALAEERHERAGWSGGGGHRWPTAGVASEGGHWCILSPLYLHPPWIDPDLGGGRGREPDGGASCGMAQGSL